jgi:hypothetical protein
MHSWCHANAAADGTAAAAVLQVSARHVESEGVQGSCTACILTINTQLGRMQAATLGDSGFYLIGKLPGRMQVGGWGVVDL